MSKESWNQEVRKISIKIFDRKIVSNLLTLKNIVVIL